MHWYGRRPSWTPNDERHEMQRESAWKMIVDLVLKYRGIVEQGTKSLSLRIYTVTTLNAHDLPIFRSHELRRFETSCRPLCKLVKWWKCAASLANQKKKEKNNVRRKWLNDRRRGARENGGVLVKHWKTPIFLSCRHQFLCKDSRRGLAIRYCLTLTEHKCHPHIRLFLFGVMWLWSPSWSRSRISSINTENAVGFVLTNVW